MLVDETLQAVAHVNDPLRVRLLGLAANFGWQRGDLALAERHSQEALDLGDSLGVTSSTAAAHGALGTVLMMRGDLDGASTECELARRLAAADGDHYTETLALLDLGLSASYAGDDTAAARYGDALDALAAVGRRAKHPRLGGVPARRTPRRARPGGGDAPPHRCRRRRRRRSTTGSSPASPATR